MTTTTEAFRKIAVRWAQDAHTSSLAAIPSVVYHYTDAAGLFGMLSSHRIWATDSRFLNDREELNHFRFAARRFIQDKSIATTDPVLDELIRHVIEWQNIESTDSVFVFSLSSAQDDLSQWRGYAKDGLGYTVGFDGRALYKPSEPKNADFAFVKVEYDHDKQERALDGAWRDIVDELRRQLVKHRGDTKKIYQQAAYQFDYIVETRAALNKHRSFASEQEWRLSSFCDHPDKDGDVHIRVSGGKLVPYIEHRLSADDGGRLPIREIGIGPGFNGGEHQRAIEALLQSTGYADDGIEVYFADTPYRNG